MNSGGNENEKEFDKLEEEINNLNNLAVDENNQNLQNNQIEENKNDFQNNMLQENEEELLMNNGENNNINELNNMNIYNNDDYYDEEMEGGDNGEGEQDFGEEIDLNQMNMQQQFQGVEEEEEEYGGNNGMNDINDMNNMNNVNDINYDEEGNFNNNENNEYEYNLNYLNNINNNNADFQMNNNNKINNNYFDNGNEIENNEVPYENELEQGNEDQYIDEGEGGYMGEGDINNVNIIQGQPNNIDNNKNIELNDMDNYLENQNLENEEEMNENVNPNEMQDNFNEENIDINNMNILNNENNDLESLKIVIMNLEQKCSSLSQENARLKMVIQKKSQNNNNKNNIEPNYELMENSIKQGSILLNDNKIKNENLKQKIVELENKNKELNYKLIESNQKLKRLQANNNNKNMNTNINEEINKLNNIIDENEIKISKLEIDKKNLEQKLDETQKSHANEIKLMLDYKNSELSIYQNILDKYKNSNIGNNNTVSNNVSNNDNLSLMNVQTQINKMKQEIAKKNNIINALNIKITQFNEDYNNKLLEIKQSSNENINQTQEQVEQLIIERDELLRKNENLTKGLMQFNDKVKEVNLIYNQKLDFFNKSILANNEKMKEYKLKVITLKKKIDELNNVIKKYRINNGETYNNYYNPEDKCLTNRYGEMNIKNSPFIENKRNVIPFTDMRNNNINNYSLTYERNGNDIDKEFFEDQLDVSQKKYLENYKIFLSGLDEQINK